MQAAAAACCGRFGEPSAEAQRLATLRQLLANSSMLVLQLEAFMKAAATHLRGVHCTSGMQVEADGLSRAVVAWIEQVQDAAVTYHDWQEQPTLSDARGIERGRAALPPLRATEDMRSIAVSRLTPPA
ncbi:MAG: hypothetical protein DMD35_08060 [Gemmatimonadetes bacterium]|nr:MAG: hypothetical protein DMD35_08060 [Gemmatimonadota bacterium]